MKVLVLLLVALCCVAAINATLLDTKFIKKYDATIKLSASAKQDKKNQKASEGDEGEVENDCTCTERENENDKKVRKEKEQKIKEKKGNGSDESGSNETKDKKVKKEKEQKVKEDNKRNGSNESGCNETKDKKGSSDNKKHQKKNNDGRKGGSSEEDRSDSREGKIKIKIPKDKNQGGNKPCGKPSKPTCNTICTLIAAPLCASPDGCEGEPKTFDNECLLDVYNCQNPKAKYKKTSDGACKPVCPQACTFDLRPVCALPDGWCAEPQTFSNPCQLSVYNCENPTNIYKFFHDGDCLTTPAPEPECGLIDCPQDVSPFCAIPTGFCGQPQTFNNRCYLEVYNCFNPDEQYEYFHEGECLTTPAPEPECGLIDCPQDESPFCALPSGSCGEPKTFHNKCYLEVYNCFNPDEQYEYFHDGECLTTPAPEPECVETACPDDNNKICGLPDGFCGEPKTFVNDCYMKVYNTFNSEEQYKYFHDGECITTPEPEPNCAAISCSNEGPAICGLPDGVCGPPQTFTNGCNLVVYNCFNPDAKYKYFHDGECLTTPEPEPNCAAISCSNEGPAICGLPDGVCGPPQTFSNGCNLVVYNCFNPDAKYKYFHDGECLTTPEPEPNCAAISCSNEGPAVCGLPDGVCGPPQTFTNGCNLVVYNCFNPDAKYKYFHDGECIEQPKECPTVCPYNYDPICAAGQSGNVKTFPNECTLESQNCLNENDQYTVVHAGECDECADIQCNKIGQPICATNGQGVQQTFGNLCMLQQYNCENCNDKFEYSYDGSCIEEPKCPTICPFNYVPICAAGQSGNIKTFSNGCTLASHNCLNENDQYTVIHDGECNECVDIQCNKIGQPICATNGQGVQQTFGNPCMLQQHNRDYCHDKFEYSYDGSCVEPVICTKEYLPVCAISPTLGSRTFSNKCERDAYISQNPADGYVAANDGECKPVCRMGCPRIYRPLCGINSNGEEKDFSNECEYEKYNCLNANDQHTIAYEGKCNQCAVACIEIYDPVCTTDGEGNEKTWGNQCELESYNCRYPNNQYSVSYAGECNQCAVACIDIYDPICTTDCNGNEKTYSNKCELDNYNCRYPNDQYTVSYAGECNQCAVACIDIYDPVCTTDCNGNEKTYSNKCELDSYNCRYPNDQYTVSYAGECNQCNVACLANYDPICAYDSDGNEKTYSNQCELDSYNCRYPFNTYSIKYNGECNNCQVACSRIYAPLCTYDSLGQERLFSNQCELDSYNCRYPNDQCTVAYNGECNNCRIGCPKIYAPICTVDSEGKERQFGNECELESYNCVNKDDQCSLSYEGECHECNFACPDVYDPVCSVDAGGNEKTFSNQCDLDNYNCRYPYSPLSVSYAGECHNCLTMCLAIYKPVCAKDSSGAEKTYSSQCELDGYNCRYPYNPYTVQYQGECKKPCVDNCPADCNPVCASSNGDCKKSDARTFANQCQLDSYNCHNPTKQLTKAADGECPVECKRLKCPSKESWICATSSDPKVKPSSFYNDCERVLHNCNNPKNKFYYSRDGQCDSGC